MSSTQSTYSAVTAVLPSGHSDAVVDDIISQRGASVLLWRSRGTLLQDRWWQQWVPPISPAKTMLQLIVPDHEVPRVIDNIVTTGRLHQQATGAVFSVPCDNVYFGPQYHQWPEPESDSNAVTTPGVNQELGIIYCIVSQNRSDRVCRAAISAGAHGPIAHYCEGRGLRDRLGWLRITKEQDQEVLIVLADRRNIKGVFDAMVEAGEFHLPGRGLIYRMNVDNGMINLPSRASDHSYDANMEQVIRAIDHLSGHTHWRDQNLGNESGESPSGSRASSVSANAKLRDQMRLSAVVRRNEADAFSDLVLDAGVPGLTLVPTFFSAAEEGCQIAGARVNDEYVLYRSILSPADATRVTQVIKDTAEGRSISDLCVYSNSVPAVMRYVAGSNDYRTESGPLLPAAEPSAVREG